jgi:hypothetical protein
MEHRTNLALATVAPITGVDREVTATVVVHPAGSGRRERPRAEREVSSHRDAATTDHIASEDGSLVTEYGLLAVVAATLAGAVISWASNGALVTLFNALLRQARALVGA